MNKKPAVKTTKIMRPRDARTINQVAEMPRDNLDCGDFWVLLNGDGRYSITIAMQKGKDTTRLNIPRSVFNKLVDWYMRPVKVKP